MNWAGVLAMVLALSLVAAPVSATEAAVIYGLGHKADKSFNESAFHGVMAVRKIPGVTVTEFEPTSDDERLAMLRQAANQADLVVVLGLAVWYDLAIVAREHPDRHFTIIDGPLDLPNVQSIRFRDDQGAFLVGMAAGLSSRSGVVGFVGGKDDAEIRRLQTGFTKGVHYVRPDSQVLAAMIGETEHAWSDPMTGFDLARTQIDHGADVLFAAAGASGLGVYQAAYDSGRLAIGVDANQNYLYPGTMLTSLIKRVDEAVEYAVLGERNGTWRSGEQFLGLKENGVGVAVDRHNQGLLSMDTLLRIGQARQAIIDGQLSVDDLPTP